MWSFGIQVGWSRSPKILGLHGFSRLESSSRGSHVQQCKTRLRFSQSKIQGGCTGEMTSRRKRIYPLLSFSRANSFRNNLGKHCPKAYVPMATRSMSFCPVGWMHACPCTISKRGSLEALVAGVRTAMQFAWDWSQELAMLRWSEQFALLARKSKRVCVILRAERTVSRSKANFLRPGRALPCAVLASMAW